MGKKNNIATTHPSGQVLINTLRLIEHAEAAAAPLNDAPDNLESLKQRLRNQQAHLKVRNVLLDHLRYKLEIVARSVPELLCLTDPSVLNALRARDLLLGESIPSASYSVDVSVQLDHLSTAMTNLIRELAKSDRSNP